MSGLLLTNIGNRNLLYQGKTIAEHIKDHQVRSAANFREFTRQLLEDPDDPENDLIKGSHEGNLRLAILDKLLEKHREEIDQGELKTLVLYYSEQQDTRNDQDTVYAARVMKNLIGRSFPALDVRLERVEGKVTDNDGLMRHYRRSLLNFLETFPDARFLICDAGGTPQMKYALKITSEFVLRPERYAVEYVNQDSTIETVPQDEYRRIIVQEQLLLMIRQLDYKGCLVLTEGRKDLARGVRELIEFAHYRFNAREADALNAAGRVPQYLNNPLLKAYIDQKPLGHKDELEEALESKGYRIVCEHLSRAQACLEIVDATAFVLYFQLAIEAYLNHLIHVNTDYKILDNNRAEDARRRFLARLPQGSRQPSGMILIMKMVKEVPEQYRHNDILLACNRLLDPENNRGKGSLRYLRNQIAHEGKGVEVNQLKGAPLPSIETLFSEFRTRFGLGDVSFYRSFNLGLEEIIRRS